MCENRNTQLWANRYNQRVKKVKYTIYIFSQSDTKFLLGVKLGVSSSYVFVQVRKHNILFDKTDQVASFLAWGKTQWSYPNIFILKSVFVFGVVYQGKVLVCVYLNSPWK